MSDTVEKEKERGRERDRGGGGGVRGYRVCEHL